MGRAAAFVLSICALAASGWAFVQHGGKLNQGGDVALLGGQEAVDVELESAATQLLQAKAETGSFSQAGLPAFHNLAIVRADDMSFCIQVSSGREARHLAGPGGTPQPGPC